MFIYIILPILLIFLLPVEGKSKVLFSLIILFTLNVCRDYSVGYDYGHNYKVMYDSYSGDNPLDDFSFDNSGMRKEIEVGWSFLEYIAKKMQMPFSFVNFLAAVLIIITLSYSIKQSPLPALSILLYVLLFRYYASYNIIRQSISAMIFVYSIQFIKNEDFIKYFLCCLFAATFHISAIYTLVLYFLPRVRITLSSSMLIILIAYIISISNMDMAIFQWLSNNGLGLGVYDKYLSIESDLSHHIFFAYLPSVFLLIPYITLTISSKVKILDLYEVLFFISIVISIMSVRLEVLFRINEYFLNATIVSIPLLLVKSSRRMKSVNWILILICSILYYSAYLFINANAIWPYKLIFIN